jgi:hypothetical protein
MDIINWIYLIKKKLVKTSVQEPDKDLIALGSEVQYAKRGDKYQTYAVPFGSAVADVEGNVLRTGIYDNYPWPVGFPVMTKTTTKVIDTPGFPTSNPIDLQGWKISGTFDIPYQVAAGSMYLGSVEFSDYWNWPFMPWKTTGTVYTYNNNTGEEIYTPLSNGALVYDYDSADTVSTEMYIVADYYDTGADFYLVYRGPSPSNELDGTISFQYEFLHNAADTPKFYYY